MNRSRLSPPLAALLNEMPPAIRQEFERMGERKVVVWDAEGRGPADLLKYAPAWLAEREAIRAEEARAQDRRETGRFRWVLWVTVLGVVGAFWAVAASHEWDRHAWAWFTARVGIAELSPPSLPAPKPSPAQAQPNAPSQ